jgi:hypothetical protein
MIDQERNCSPADREWSGWPTDLMQNALEVIATTRYQWASQGPADDADADRARFAHPLFRLELDAKSSSALRARGLRARSMRRASRHFAG